MKSGLFDLVQPDFGLRIGIFDRARRDFGVETAGFSGVKSGFFIQFRQILVWESGPLGVHPNLGVGIAGFWVWNRAFMKSIWSWQYAPIRGIFTRDFNRCLWFRGRPRAA